MVKLHYCYLIWDSKRFEERHILGSACAICNEESKKSIMPRLPKDLEIIRINTGNKPMPIVNEVYELEMGPNRCSILRNIFSNFLP
jgi:hypothetical protein